MESWEKGEKLLRVKWNSLQYMKKLCNDELELQQTPS